MTTEEAFVKVLQKHGIQHAFGIIGSAFMPISDLFPKAGITFWDVAHETNGGIIADGYTRATGKMSMCIAQNGPWSILSNAHRHLTCRSCISVSYNPTIGFMGNIPKSYSCFWKQIRYWHKSRSNNAKGMLYAMFLKNFYKCFFCCHFCHKSEPLILISFLYQDHKSIL